MLLLHCCSMYLCRSYRCLCDTSATVQTRDLNTHSALGYSYLPLQRAHGDHTDVPALSSPGQALRVFIVAVRCVYLRRPSVQSLVPIFALLFSDSTSPLLCHVACTIRKNVCVKFWVGTTAMLPTDVYLTAVTLLFYVRMVLVPA